MCMNHIQKIQIRLWHEWLLLQMKIASWWVSFLFKTGFLLVIIFPKLAASYLRFHAGYFCLNFLVFDLYQSLLLALSPFVKAKLSLEVIVTWIVSIDCNFLSRSWFDGGNTVSHMPILYLDFITFVLGQISIVLQPGCIIYCAMHGWIEPVLDFGSSSLDILVVMSFILKVHEKFGLLSSHWIFYLVLITKPT